MPTKKKHWLITILLLSPVLATFPDKGRYWIGVEGTSEGFVGSASPHISLSNGNQKFELNIDAYKNKPAYQLIIVQ